MKRYFKGENPNQITRSLGDSRLAGNEALQPATKYVCPIGDDYRHLLYEALRWTLPENPDEERRVGQQLTQYLWRGEIVTRLGATPSVPRSP